MITACRRGTVLRVTYKKTRRVRARGDGDAETGAMLRVVLRTILDDSQPPGLAGSTTAANRRITLWTSDCSAPFCSRRRLKLRRDKDYLVMGHEEPNTGRLVLDRRSVVAKWKTRWPAKIQVHFYCLVHVGWQWHNFVLYLCQLVFAAILCVQLL